MLAKFPVIDVATRRKYDEYPVFCLSLQPWPTTP